MEWTAALDGVFTISRFFFSNAARSGIGTPYRVHYRSRHYRCWLFSPLLAALLLALILALGACASPAPTLTPTPPPANPQFSAILASQDLAVGPNRVAFGLVDLNGMPVRTDEAQVQAVYFAPGQNQGQMRDSAVARFMRWPPPGERGIYITQLTFDVAAAGTGPQDGLWELQITTTTTEGVEVAARTALRVAEKSSTPAIGAPAPPSVTLTSAAEKDLRTITSASDPDPDLYQLSIHQALLEAKPLVVVFATPAFCVSATCGPQVEMVSQLKERYRDRVNFIHVEVFENPHLIEGGRPGGGLVSAVEEWGLPTEPWTFVVDREGRIRAKFEQFTPADEIEAALIDLL